MTNANSPSPVPTPLSGFDSAFIYIEQPLYPMHMMATVTLDVSTMPGGYEFERLEKHMLRRFANISMFKRHLRHPPFWLGHPFWVERGFNPADHVDRLTLDGALHDRALGDLVAEFVSTPLQRDRPLWRFLIIEHLDEDRVTIVAKIHHSLIDGMGLSDTLALMFDLEPLPGDDSAVPEQIVEPEPGRSDLLAIALRDRARRVRQLPSLLRESYGALREIARLRRQRGKSPHAAGPLIGPRVPWTNAARSAERGHAFLRLSLSEAREIKNAFGVTLNELILALLAGMLRGYLIEEGQLPTAPLVATIPTNVRRPEEQGLAGNKVSNLFCRLPTHLHDPEERVQFAASASELAKAQHDALGERFWLSWFDYLGPQWARAVSRVFVRFGWADHVPPFHSVVSSNIVGPDFPLYVDGARVLSMNGIPPVMPGSGMIVTSVSFEGWLDVGVMVARDLVPDAWRLMEHGRTAFDELSVAAQAVTATGRGGSPPE